MKAVFASGLLSRTSTQASRRRTPPVKLQLTLTVSGSGPGTTTGLQEPLLLRPFSKEGWMKAETYSLRATLASIRARRMKKFDVEPVVPA